MKEIKQQKAEGLFRSQNNFSGRTHNSTSENNKLFEAITHSILIFLAINFVLLL